MGKKVKDEISSNEKTRSKLASDTKVLREEIKDALKNQQQIQSLIFQVDANAHRVISLLNVAQDQLYLGKNPRRALVYLNDAAEIIETSREHIDSADLESGVAERMIPIVGELNTSVQSLKADCFLALGDTGELKEVAKALVCPEGKICKNYEAHFYAGLVSLDEMTHTDDETKIRELRDQAADQFRRSLQGASDRQQRHPSLIFLAGLEVIRGDYRAAKIAAEQFHESSDEPSDNVFLPSRIRTLGELASAWGAIAEFIRGDEPTLPEALTCSGSDASITPFEAELLESLFRHVIAERDVLIGGEGDDTAADMLGNYCASTIAFLRSTCGEESHCTDCGSDDGGCAPTEEEPKSVMDQLRETYELHPVESVGDVSNDASYGRIVGDRLLMSFRRMAPHQEEETYTVNVPIYETVAVSAPVPKAEGEAGEAETVEYTVTRQTCRPEQRTRTIKVWSWEIADEFFDLKRKDSLPRRCYINIAPDAPTVAPAGDAPPAPADPGPIDAAPAAKAPAA